MRSFKRIYIEITNCCNLSCSFCPAYSRPRAFMTKEMFIHIMKAIKGYTEYIYFHVMGEPLLHPLLGEFLQIAKVYGYHVNITSNAVLLGEKRTLLIGEKALRQMNLSLHSFDDNVQKITKEEYLNAVYTFIRDTRPYDTLVALRLWNLSDEQENERNADILSSIETEFNLPYQIKEQQITAKGLTLCKNVFLNQASRFEWPDINREFISDRGFCYGLRTQLAILVDGTVVPCCLDSEGKIPLGNIMEQSLPQIVDGERAAALYNGFTAKQAVEPLCQRCGYRTRFK